MSIANSNITETTGWTREQELLLQNWGEKAQGHSKLHKSSEKHYQKLSNIITIPTSLLAGLSGSVQFSLIHDTSDNFWVKLGTAFTTCTVSLLSILQKALNYQSLEERHRKMAIDFSSLYRDISAELSIPPSERQNSKDYILTCRTEMDKLTKASPNIPDDIIEEFNKSHQNVDVHKPDIVEGLKPIVIYDKSLRVRNSYKKELNRKLHMQKTFYEWKSAVDLFRRSNSQTVIEMGDETLKPIEINRGDKEPIKPDDVSLDIVGDNIELTEK